MAEIIEFEITHYHNLRETGIPLKVKLSYGGLTEEFTAKINTGSTYCIFRRLHGSALKPFLLSILPKANYFDRNVLGRIGWLDRVKLGLIEQEGKLFLSEYKH